MTRRILTTESIFMKVILCAVLFAATASNAVPTAAQAQPRSITDLQPHAVVGQLGEPLGTRLLVSGIRAEHVILMLSPLLAVSEVNKQKLDHPVAIAINTLDGLQFELKAGTHYVFEGYETGELSGPPEWLTPGAQMPFQFRSLFVVTKVIEPVEKHNRVDFKLRHPTKKHLSAEEIYHLGEGQMYNAVGQFTAIDVLVKATGKAPLVEIIAPDESIKRSHIQAQLTSLTTTGGDLSELEQGQRVTIEGIIVSQGYNAYEIYVYHVQTTK